MGLITGYSDTAGLTSDDRMLGLDGGATKLIRPDDVAKYVGRYRSVDQILTPSGGDDTAAVAAVLAAGGIAYIFPGAWSITSLTLSVSGSGIVGVGTANDTTITCTGSATTAITITANARTRLENFKLLKGASSVTHGIAFNYTATATTAFRHNVEHVEVQDFTTGKGFSVSGTEMCRFADLVAYNNSCGFYSTTNPSGGGLAINNEFIRCRSQATTGVYGWDINHQMSGTIFNCQALGSGTGLGTDSQAIIRGACRNMRISGFDVENGDHGGVGTGLTLAGSEHNVDIHAHAVTTALALSACAKTFVGAIKTSSVTNAVTVDSTSSNCVIVETATGAYTVNASATGIVRVGLNGVITGPALTVRTGRNVTGSRPAAGTVGNGAMFYDTTLSKPIWSDGTVWRDAAGTAV